MTQNELAWQRNQVSAQEAATHARQATNQERETSIKEKEYQLRKDKQGWDIASNMISSVGGVVTGLVNPLGRIGGSVVQNSGRMALEAFKAAHSSDY